MPEKGQQFKKLENIFWKSFKSWLELEKGEDGKIKVTKFVENGLACTTRRIKPPKKLRKLQERNVKEKLVNKFV